MAARAVSEALMTQLWHRPWNESLVPTDEQRDKCLGLIDTDTYTGLYLALSIQQSAPLNTAVDCELHTTILPETAPILRDKIRLVNRIKNDLRKSK